MGYHQNVCLHDQGGKCSNENDCANFLICNSNGTCGCDVSISLLDIQGRNGTMQSGEKLSVKIIKVENI